MREKVMVRRKTNREIQCLMVIRDHVIGNILCLFFCILFSKIVPLHSQYVILPYDSKFREN